MSGARRWLGYLALVVVFSVACAMLAAWQFARNDQAAERIRQIEENWDAAPVPLATVLAAPDSAFDPRRTWTPVEVTGEYLVEETLLVRNRPRDGVPGYEVLVPFQLADGTVLIVDRGWVPPGERQAEHPDSVPEPKRGEQTIIVRLRVGEPPVPGRSAPAGQVATIELPLIAELLDAPVYTGAFGMLASESASPVSGAPALAVRPAIDPGPHLSYAVQWILFAVMAGIALVWGVWNERRIRRLSPAEREAERHVRRARRDADAEAEDALLDA
ncbi:MAG TPA: SURF1 family protein [Microbacteriaceae bacterium]|nr:SURF1 family protein [Microbacteriaceae bacterium]